LVLYGMFFGIVNFLFIVIFGSLARSLNGGVSPEIILFSGTIAIFSTMLLAFKKYRRDLSLSEKRMILTISTVIAAAIEAIFIFYAVSVNAESIFIYALSVAFKLFIFSLIIKFSWTIFYSNERHN